MASAFSFQLATIDDWAQLELVELELVELELAELELAQLHLRQDESAELEFSLLELDGASVVLMKKSRSPRSRTRRKRPMNLSNLAWIPRMKKRRPMKPAES